MMTVKVVAINSKHSNDQAMSETTSMLTACLLVDECWTTVAHHWVAAKVHAPALSLFLRPDLCIFFFSFSLVWIQVYHHHLLLLVHTISTSFHTFSLKALISQRSCSHFCHIFFFLQIFIFISFGGFVCVCDSRYCNVAKSDRLRYCCTINYLLKLTT